MKAHIFDPQNPKYFCCFGNVHVKTATKLIWYLSFVLDLILVSFVIIQNLESYPGIRFFALILGFTASLFVYGSAFYAFITEKAKWIIPFLVICGFWCISVVNSIGIEIVNENYCDGLIYIGIINLIVNIWCTFVVYRFYQYLDAKTQGGVLPISFSNNVVTSPEKMKKIREENV
uniref:Uncharacterized protein n=1 Tax=Panagrolaimus sp. ES5 TaxID=591445 RepID=A0AC34FV91_9BILA